MLYGSHIFALVVFVTAIKYIIKAMVSHPIATVAIRFNLLSRLHCFLFCPWIRASSVGLKSALIRGAVSSMSATQLISRLVNFRPRCSGD